MTACPRRPERQVLLQREHLHRPRDVFRRNVVPATVPWRLALLGEFDTRC